MLVRRISPAPSASYSSASKTGSPASRRSTKPVPLTTRPSITSRQAMILLVSITHPQRYRSFRAERVSGIDQRVTERQPERLEGGFYNVMAVASAQHEDVDRRPRLVAERSHPVIVKTARQRSLVIRSSADIDRHLHQSIVHRHHAISVSRGTGWNDLSKRAAQR